MPNTTGFQHNVSGKTKAQLVEELGNLRKQVQDLQENAAWLETILDNAPTEITLKDVEGQYLLVNRMWREHTGLSNDEVRGKTPYDVFPREFAEVILAHQHAVQGTGETIKRDISSPVMGDVRDFISIKFPIREASGEIVSIGSISTDITERKRMEAELRHSRDHLRLITDNLPVLISYFDTDQRFHFVNKTAQEWYSCSEQEILGRTIKEIIGPKAHDQLGSRLDAALSGKEQCFEHDRSYPNGKKRHVETTYVPHLDDEGEVQGCFALVRDISVRKWAEEELTDLNAELEERIEQRTSDLQASEARLRAFLDNSPAATYLKDLEGRYIMAGRTILEWYGLKPEEFLGKTSYDLAPKEKADAYVSQDRAAMQTEQPVTLEEEQVLADEKIHTFLVTKFPVFSPDDALMAVGGIDIDITERKHLENELLRKARLATLGQLTATVSHELRNPLGVIRTSTHTLRYGLKEEAPRAWRSLERIERSVVRCDRIIDELLDFTRIQDIQLQPTHLDAWLKETLNEQTLPAEVKLRADFGMPDMTVPLDRDRFRRVIINVFDNACQAMTGEGMGDVGSQERVLTVRTQEHDGRVELIFEDTGPGIPPDVYASIFEPLFSTKGFGMGLGLPVVKQIMEQHGGGIEIESESELGRGTRVCLWLPHDHSNDRANPQAD